MENLYISNFLVIKEAKLEVKKINVIIGSQGTGKSVIVKALYFFQEIGSIFRKCLIEEQSLDKVYSEIEEKFLEIFPNYAWKNQDFEIIYEKNNIKISINNFNNKFTPKLSGNLASDYNISLLRFVEVKNELDISQINDNELFKFPKRFLYKRAATKILQESSIDQLISSPTFIPATRAFFSLFQENLFSFINTAQQNLDPFIKDFGQLYEGFRGFYNKNKEKIYKDFPIHFIQDIMKGEIIEKDNQLYILDENQREIALAQASSGQQEALPMLLTLAVLAFFSETKKDLIYIEEPEAHLFPISQALTIKILSYLYGKDLNFILTTHSPYVLSELNNYLYAGSLIKRNLLNLEDFNRILPNTTPIQSQDLSAYKIENGHLINIIDHEFEIIDSNEIDVASEHSQYIFNLLLDYEENQI